MRYRPEIDGLRALAVIPVILFHTGMDFFSGGFIGVDVFFVISGYLITTLILNELEKEKFSLTKFYERRARRILPALFLVIFISVPVAWFLLLPSDMIDFAQSLISIAFFSSNILFWQESGYFDTSSELKPLLHTWSLAVEEQFYLLFPLFILMIWKLGKIHLITFITISLILSFGIAQWGVFNSPSAAFYLLPPRGWELLTGAITAFGLKYYTLKANSLLSSFAAFTGLILITFPIFLYDSQTPFPGLYALPPVLGSVLIIIYANDNNYVYRLLSQKILVKTGLISYSAYLWHYPLMAFIKYSSEKSDQSFLLPITVLVSFLFAYFSWKNLELPFRDKTKISSRVIFYFSMSGILIIAGIGGWLLVTNGGINRYTEKEQKVLSQYINAPDYVVKKFKSLEGSPFDENFSTPNLLVIGDSYAQDLVNALFEGKIGEKVSISTHYIPAICGNLYLKNILESKDFNTHTCENTFENSYLTQRMMQSHFILLASSWNNKVIDSLGESLDNIRKISNAQIIVIGSKNFGERTVRDYNISGTVETLLEEREINSVVSENYIKIKNEISKKAIYVDTAYVLCGSYTKCNNRTPQNLPISYDGGHLTKSGAQFLGGKLYPLLMPIFFPVKSLETN